VALLLAFSACLLAAVLVSARAHRTVLSTAVLFWLGGVALSAANLVSLSPEDDVVTSVAEVALFGVLFSDGMRSGVRDLASAWHLPVSILAHSSTGVVVARWLDRGEPAESGDGAAAGEVSAGRA
jgi:Kef-type K+ transport system membrane component KefB